MKNKNKFKIKEVLYFDNYRLFLTEEKEENDILYYAYLQNISYGIISMMFGFPKKSTKFEEFKKICLNCLDEYILTYKEDYED